MKMFRGVFTALVTPFNRDGSIDHEALKALVDVQIEAGIDGLVPMGSTGESATVTHDENIVVVETVVKQAAGRVPVIAGTGSNATAEAVRMTKMAADVGANATLQVAPYYNKPTQEGLYLHFTTIAEATELPIIVYNIPGRTSINVANETMLRLAAHPKIAGVKEASGSMPQVMGLIGEKPEGFDVLSGDDNHTLPVVALGGTGTVSVSGNFAPRLMVSYVHAALDGEYEKARDLHYRLLPLFQASSIRINPIPIKYAMATTGMIQEIYRLPLCPLDENDRKIIDEAIARVGPE
jgi:4-hydroxy-tetrahydrodipicolinate synthase